MIFDRERVAGVVVCVRTEVIHWYLSADDEACTKIFFLDPIISNVNCEVAVSGISFNSILIRGNMCLPLQKPSEFGTVVYSNTSLNTTPPVHRHHHHHPPPPYNHHHTTITTPTTQISTGMTRCSVVSTTHIHTHTRTEEIICFSGRRNFLLVIKLFERTVTYLPTTHHPPHQITRSVPPSHIPFPIPMPIASHASYASQIGVVAATHT